MKKQTTATMNAAATTNAAVTGNTSVSLAIDSRMLASPAQAQNLVKDSSVPSMTEKAQAFLQVSDPTPEDPKHTKEVQRIDVGGLQAPEHTQETEPMEVEETIAEINALEKEYYEKCAQAAELSKDNDSKLVKCLSTKYMGKLQDLYESETREHVKDVIATIVRERVKEMNVALEKKAIRGLLYSDLLDSLANRYYEKKTVKISKKTIVFGKKQVKITFRKMETARKKAYDNGELKGTVLLDTIVYDKNYKFYLDIFADNLALYHQFAQSAGMEKSASMGKLRNEDRDSIPHMDVTYCGEKANFRNFSRSGLRGQMNVIFTMLLGPGTKIHPNGASIDDVIKRVYTADKNTCSDRKIANDAEILESIVDAIETIARGKNYFIETGVKTGKVDGKKELVEDAKETAKADLLKMLEDADAETLTAMAKTMAKKAKTA